MGDEKNFRSQFYEKVGLHEVEAKRAVEALLKEQPLNDKKLAHFSQRSVVPSPHRTLVWKVLLGVAPCYAESKDYVLQQQTLMFHDLWDALKALGLGNVAGLGDEPINGHEYLQVDFRNNIGSSHAGPETPAPEHYLLMWLMSEAKLLYNPRHQLRLKANRQFLPIARKVSSFFDNPVDAYHVCSALWSLLLKNESAITDAIEEAIGMLRKENDMLHCHLRQIGLFSCSLLKDQCMSLFCDILPESAVEKVFDKIIAGAFKVLSFITVALLVRLRRSLASVTTVDGVKYIMYDIRKEDADIVVAEALDQWLKVGLVKRS